MDYGSKLKVVRATLRQCLRVAAIPNAPGECQVTFHQHLVSGGWIPNFVSKSKISTSLRPVVFLHQHVSLSRERAPRASKASVKRS